MRKEEEGGSTSPLARSQAVVLAWILGQSSLNPRNNELSTGRRERKVTWRWEDRWAPSQCLIEKNVPWQKAASEWWMGGIRVGVLSTECRHYRKCSVMVCQGKLGAPGENVNTPGSQRHMGDSNQQNEKCSLFFPSYRETWAYLVPGNYWPWNTGAFSSSETSVFSSCKWS